MTFTRISANYIFATIFIAILYFMPAILSDRYYIDDIGRSIYGYSDWIYNGRPLADFVMKSLNFGMPLVDLSPATQILSVALLSYFLSCASYAFTGTLNYKNILIPSIFFLSNPFFLENISYKFDSLPMTLSLCAIILCFILSGGIFFRLVLGVAMIVSSLSLYQASIGCFVGLSVIEACFNIYKSSNGQKTTNLYKDIIIRITQLIIGYLLYSTLISPFTIAGEYNTTHATALSGSIYEISNAFAINFKLFHHKVIEAIKPILKLSVFVLSICYLSYFLILKRLWKKDLHKADLIFKSLILIASPVLIFLAGFVHLCLLKYPVPAPRVYISMGSFFMYIAISLCWMTSRKDFHLLILTPLAGYFFVFSYAYGNVMKSQKELDGFIVKNIALDLHSHRDVLDKISIIGIMPQSRQREMASIKMPLMDDLVPIYMDNGWGWGPAMLAHYGKAYFFEQPTKEELSEICKRNSPDVYRGDYSVYYLGNKAVVSFKKTLC